MEAKLNCIEEKLLNRWELLTGRILEDAECQSIYGEIVLFMDALLPREPSEDWAFWTDGNQIMTRSEELANRLNNIVIQVSDYSFGYSLDYENTYYSNYWYLILE